jgi:hypothetical protein
VELRISNCEMRALAIALATRQTPPSARTTANARISRFEISQFATPQLFYEIGLRVIITGLLKSRSTMSNDMAVLYIP